MRIGVLGINYKSAEIGIRECVSKTCLKRISRDSQIAEKYNCVVLSTCNRTEIYFSADNLAEAHSDLLNILREEIATAFEHKLYSYFGVDCFLHLAQVTAGLDSAILAESEIQRQVKLAYEQTLLHFCLPSCMHFLFQKSLRLGKEIRSKLSLSENQMTIEKMLFQLSEHLLENFAEQSVFFIGNSEINRKVLAHFKRKGIHRITLCTRSPYSAQEMAKKDHIALLSWDKLSEWQKYSLVICGSNAPHYLIDRPGNHFSTRLICDLSVPRNVNPILSRHPSLTLINMEELSGMIESRQTKNRCEIDHAEAIIQRGVQRYLHSFRQKEKRVYLCA